MTTTRTPNWTYGQPRGTAGPAGPSIPVRTGHVKYEARNPEVAKLAAKVFTTQGAAGRAVGKVRGYTGRAGGWIYAPNGATVCQGWASVANHLVRWDDDAKGYRLGELALRRLDDYLDRQAAQR